MAKIILQISYEIKPEKREEYLALIKKLKKHFIDDQKKIYTVYEQKGRKNFFIEQFVCNSQEEYDALEDGMTEISSEMINHLTTMLKDGKAKYATLVEI